MVSKQSRSSSSTTKFLVKRRKELGEYLTEKNVEMQYTEISLKSIERVKNSLHARHFMERLSALSDSKGENALLKCLYSNFRLPH